MQDNLAINNLVHQKKTPTEPLVGRRYSHEGSKVSTRQGCACGYGISMCPATDTHHPGHHAVHPLEKGNPLLRRVKPTRVREDYGFLDLPLRDAPVTPQQPILMFFVHESESIALIEIDCPLCRLPCPDKNRTLG